MILNWVASSTNRDQLSITGGQGWYETLALNHFKCIKVSRLVYSRSHCAKTYRTLSLSYMQTKKSGNLSLGCPHVIVHMLLLSTCWYCPHVGMT